METDGFAREFKRTVGREDEIEKVQIKDKVPEMSLLINPTRLKILQHLCQQPCDTLTGIAKAVNISLPTAKFHLEKLTDSKILLGRHLQNKMIYFPEDLVKDESLDILALLNEPKTRKAYNLILRNPGIKQKDICIELNVTHQALSRYILKLDQKGLITIFVEGRNRRYFPTELYKTLERLSRARIRYFKERILRKFKSDGLKPHVIRASEKELWIQLNVGFETSTIKLQTNPFQNIFDKI